MTQVRFYNLDEASHYRDTCPICKDRVRSEDMDFRYEYQQIVAKFNLGDTTLEVDYHSNAILNVTQHTSYDRIYTIGSNTYSGMVPQSHRSLHKTGIDLISMRMACANKNCGRYRYLVQVHTSLEQNRLVALVLNSETLSIEDNAKLYTIKNIYTTDKTELEVRHTHVSHLHSPQDKIEYPLIPLNIEEPLKTVERLKKLTVFL
jgi:hypothetical protein